ncbi:uncharacterized protein [Procambarus clarkii]|uniref:uncharacterized protein isoform X2 n=1 Tax=Procambarus clarkii TaxID=6728 RepID=UPI001E671AF9|nr:uncharacterized protein LOC123754004 isoform X2 [Procambarus clarkii]
MGSSCLIKTCTVKKTKVGASFHRLPWKYPSLFRTLQHVFGNSNVRELTRWSRICSLHIAQLAPLAATDDVVRRLMEYYAWNARSYKRIFELSKLEEAQDVKGCVDEALQFLEGEQVLDNGSWSLEDLVKNGVFVLRNCDGVKGEASCGDWQSVASNKSESSQPSEEEEVGAPGLVVSRAHTAQVESGHYVGQYLLQLLAGTLAHTRQGDRSMIPDDSAAGAMDAARDPDVCMDEDGKSKKTGCGEEQDINDNHTKLAAQGNTSGEANNVLTNGEVQTKESGNKESVDEPSRTNECEEDRDNKMEMEVEETEEPQVDIEGSEDEKDSSEDDEDKLVISEGNERGTEESADENSKEEAPIVSQKSTSRSPTPKGSEKRPAEDEAAPEIATKRPRPLEDMISLESLTSVSQVEGSLGQVKRDLEALEFLIKQKEEEWNALLRLQKRKEELYIRLARRRHVLLMKNGQGDIEGEGIKVGEETSEEGRSNLMFLPQGGYSSLGGPQLPLMMMSQLIAGSASPQALQMLPQVVTTKDNSQGESGGNSNSNISVIDIHTSSNKPGSETPKVSMTPEAHSKLSKQLSTGLASMKPILPKPAGGMSAMSGLPTSLSFTATGHGPQGPTVNVQHLIAAHRKENPNTPPISPTAACDITVENAFVNKPLQHIRRAARGAWRHRYDGDKRTSRDQDRPPSVSSSSSDADTRTTPSSKSFLAMSDPSVSYKDVLLRFAELTQIEKQPGSPQISIFPVGSSDGGPKRSDGSRESTPVMRDQTPSLPSTIIPPTTKSSLEAPSALAKLLLESRASVTSSNLVKAVGESASNSQYLTLSALLSGGSTTTVKDKAAAHSQAEGRNKKSSHQQEEGSGNPKCQGCHKQRAQFVCAGCGNQWYCSRECQVAAWEEHSEHCNN